MKDVQLVRLDAAIEASLESDPAFLDAMMSENWPRAAEVVLRHFGHKLLSKHNAFVQVGGPRNQRRSFTPA